MRLRDYRGWTWLAREAWRVQRDDAGEVWQATAMKYRHTDDGEARSHP